jgi:hypothetical protein
MHKHNNQRAVGPREGGIWTTGAAWVCLALGALLLTDASARASANPRPAPRGLESKLSKQIADFDNHSVPLVPTLLGISAKYHVPMGIETVTAEALDRPIAVRLPKGTVADLLDVCARQVAGYRWVVREGAVDFFGKREWEQASNLFNLVIPSFRVSDETADAISDKLRTAIIMRVEKPTGIIGSYLGSPDLGDKKLTFESRDATVRDILNRVVALHGSAVWIARVPEDQLSVMPGGGLWQILPRTVQDPRYLLGPFRYEVPPSR